MCEIYEKISELCKSKDVSVSQLCRELRISRSALSELKSGRSKSLTAKNTSLISEYFGIPVEFLNGTGVFSNWREIMNHIENVFYKLQEELPANFYWHEDDEKNLFALLHTRFYYGNEIPLFVNWLYAAVEKISITEEIDDYCQDYDSDDDTPTVEIKFTFKKDFENRIKAHKSEERSIKAVTFRDALSSFIARHQTDTSKESEEELCDCPADQTDDPSLPTEPKSKLSEKNILRLAGRDGRYIERVLSDDQIEMLRALVEQLPKVPDDL